MSEWLISIEGCEYRVKAESRNGAITEAVNRHLKEVGSQYNRSLLKLMARSRKLAWKEYVRAEVKE